MQSLKNINFWPGMKVWQRLKTEYWRYLNPGIANLSMYMTSALLVPCILWCHVGFILMPVLYSCAAYYVASCYNRRDCFFSCFLFHCQFLWSGHEYQQPVILFLLKMEFRCVFCWNTWRCWNSYSCRFYDISICFSIFQCIRKFKNFDTWKFTFKKFYVINFVNIWVKIWLFCCNLQDALSWCYVVCHFVMGQGLAASCKNI
jgi:hypothetical protein